MRNLDAFPDAGNPGAVLAAEREALPGEALLQRLPGAGAAGRASIDYVL